MLVLVDTNILLRAIQPEHPMNGAALGALGILMKQAEPPVIAFQNVAEFWNVCTRPAAQNGLGLSTDEAKGEVARLERYFRILHEDPNSYAAWKDIVAANRVAGVQVHDARLVSVMKTHGIPRILTFNTGDFRRYDGIEAVDPDHVSG